MKLRCVAPAAVAAGILLLTGCTGGQAPQATDPATEAVPGAADSGTGTAAAPPASDPGTTSTGSSPGWKRYSDPSNLVAFELPEAWIVQAVPPAEGTAEGAVALQVKNGEGAVLAELRTGIQGLDRGCDAAGALPYTVLSSVPMELPAVGDQPGVHVEPRFVFRVLQGYRFFGSYGITNLVGGPDNRACRLYNVVEGPAPVNGYMFGDVLQATAPAPADPVEPLKAFNTIAEAQEYSLTPEFQTIQRMIVSLRVTP